MLTKLTLTIDRDVVLKAKSYAQRKRRSVSKLVEDYLMTISSTENSKSDKNTFAGTLTNSITGMFKEEYGGESYKELLENAIMERNI
ncbi:MAG: hypothetical protein JXM71_11965 [Spirochaetales bacterium]|nr:hypothetical protein [Spirochaetales bacterium]